MNHTTRNEETVRRFIEQFADGWPTDFDAALAPLREDASYQIIVPSIAPIRGRAAIKQELLRMQSKVVGQRSELKSLVGSGSTVFNERIDYSRRIGGEWCSIPLVAVFDLDEAGQIVDWREFMDSAAIAAQHGMTVEQLQQVIGG